jgi:hypothetical protein
MSRRKQLTPEQTAALNRALRHLASELERRKALREAGERSDQSAREVERMCKELVEA